MSDRYTNKKGGTVSMATFVQPQTFIIGYTMPDLEGLRAYLHASHQMAFLDDLDQACLSGVHPGEALCSFYAKLCYASLVPGLNANLKGTRSISANLLATLDHGHGSVFEHCWINFVTSNCSRVFTHELVRHRVGTAYSQESGRYVRVDNLQLVLDPILEPVRAEAQDLLEMIEMRYQRMVQKMGLDKENSFDIKKKVTSALRRFLPNGLANEMGWSANLRTIRHLIMLRTSRHAEWEIRMVFNQVFEQMLVRFPTMFHDAKTRMVDGALEVYGMKMQPYELIEETPRAVQS